MSYTGTGRLVDDTTLYRVMQACKTFTVNTLAEHANSEESHPNKVEVEPANLYDIDNISNSILSNPGLEYKVGAAYIKASNETFIPVNITGVDTTTGEILSINIPSNQVYADVNIADGNYSVYQFDNSSAEVSLTFTETPIDMNTTGLLEQLLALKTRGLFYYINASSLAGGGGGETGSLPGTKFTSVITIQSDIPSYIVNHNLNSSDVIVQTIMNGEIVYINTNIVDHDNISLNFGETAAEQLDGTDIKVIVLNINSTHGGINYKFTTNVRIDEGVTVYNINHGLLSEDVIAQFSIIDGNDREVLMTKITVIDINNISIDIGDAVTQYAGKTGRVVII